MIGSGVPPNRVSRPAAAFAGIAATGAALATGELLAGVIAGIPSPILSIGRLVVDLQPPGAKEVVVSLFGTADKLALEILILVAALAIGAGLGVLARDRPGIASAALGGFVVLGVVAGLRDPDVQPTLAALAGLAELAVGATALDRLLRPGRPRPRLPPSPRPRQHRTGPAGRSSFAAGAWRSRRSRPARSAARSSIASVRQPTGTLPAPEIPADVPSGADFGLPELTPIVVPTEDFYRIDTALIVPNVDRDAWRLRIHGLVDSEVTLAFADLLELPVIEQYVTIACVSNRVGGDLIGNAKWTGVRLRDVLDLAGVRDGATQLVGRSADGWTAGMPVAWIMDPEREPMIALGMNGQPLSRMHGFPARLIVPGLYGYVSATKWVTELELTTLEAFDAYWVPLGWAKEAPILTQSRIDRPGRDARIPAGPYAIAGVAWAMDRGVAKVEVQVDDAEWRRGDPVGADLRRDLDPVEDRLGRDPGRAQGPGPGHGFHRRDPDRGRHPSGPERRPGLAHRPVLGCAEMVRADDPGTGPGPGIR